MTAPDAPPVCEAERVNSPVSDLVREIRMHRRVFAAVALTIALLVVVYAILAPPSYKVSVKVLIRSGEQQGGAGLQSLVSTFGGLAALAGVNVTGSVDEQEALAWLKSRRLAGQFIERENLMPELFADRWDARARSWRAGLSAAKIPTLDAAWRSFDEGVRRIDQDQKTRVITIQMIWRDRILATRWANDFVSLANDQLRSRVNQEADASLRILGEQLMQTTVLDLQQTIYKMMAGQINRKVVANSRPDYAYSVIDPAMVPDVTAVDSPHRRLLMVMALPLGIFVASCLLIARLYVRQLLR